MSSIGPRSWEKMEENTPLSHEVVNFQILDIETSCVIKREVSNQFKYFTER